MLAAHVPDLEVHVVEGDCGDVLADGGNGGFGRGGGVVVEGFDGGEEGRFAGVVEAEEEDGVFCLVREVGSVGLEGARTIVCEDRGRKFGELEYAVEERKEWVLADTHTFFRRGPEVHAFG